MSEYKEDVTDEIPGAKEARLKVELVQDSGSSMFNPRDNDGNATLVTRDREYADYDERDKDGSHIVLDWEPDEDNEYGAWEWSDDWSATCERLEAKGCVATMVRRAYDGGLEPECDGHRFACGILYYTPEQLAEYWTDATDKTITARASLESELDEYSKWATGDVWGVVISRVNRQGSVLAELDACWGFIGDDYAREAAKEQAAPFLNDEIDVTKNIDFAWKVVNVYNVTHLMDEEDKQNAITDVLADLMHWCDEYGTDFNEAIESARMHYAAEIKGEL